MFSITQVVQELLIWWQKLLDFMPRAVIGLIIFAVFVIIGRVVRKIVKRAVDHFSDSPSFIRLSGTLAFIIVLLIGAAVALNILGLDDAATSLLAGVGVVGLALGFAFQDIASNFISGAALSIKKQFEIGDLIEAGEFFGDVVMIDLRSTTIRTAQGQLVTMPNKKLFQEPVINYTESGERRIDISCGVSYGDDLEKARYVAVEAIKSLPETDTEKPVDVHYDEFDDSSVNFYLRFWIKYPETDYLETRSKAIQTLKSAFDKEGISIPFPMRTVEMANPKS